MVRDLFLIIAGFMIGFNWMALVRSIKSTFRKLRMGICFRYLEGPRENRNGTISNFCLRCGHPYGYHK